MIYITIYSKNAIYDYQLRKSKSFYLNSQGLKI